MEFNRFSQNAREAIEVARTVVRRGQGNQLGTEHLLLGLLAQGEGVVHRVCGELGLDLGLARTKTDDAVRNFEPSRASRASERIHLIPRVKRALELAVEESEKLGDALMSPWSAWFNFTANRYNRDAWEASVSNNIGKVISSKDSKLLSPSVVASFSFNILDRHGIGGH
jgi:ATP-dependent Clp protease ATP-binding subunit ClpA